MSGLEIDVERMRSNLEESDGLILAERISFALTPRLGRRDAHAVVAEAARAPSFRDALLTDERVGISAEELDELIDPDGYLGAAGALVDRSLEDYEKDRP